MRFKTQLFIIKVNQKLLTRAKNEDDRLRTDIKLYNLSINNFNQ